MSNTVAIILGSNIHWAPYFYRYEKILNDLDISFDLIFWNREGLKEQTSGNCISWDVPDVSNNKDPKKFFKFLGFSHFVEKQIRQHSYSRLVFLGTHGCAVSFCSNYLAKYYKSKMWIDIRDDEYEWFPPFYWGECKSIAASYATTISSYKYTTFLPKHDYLMMHNIDPNWEAYIKEYHKVPSDVIRISFIGNVRYFEQNVAIIKILGNDQRFRLQYFGSGSEKIQAYCEEHGITNTEFHGRFPQEDTLSFYCKTDIINNAYGNDTLNLQTALSNKLYYGLMFHLPILVSEKTFMEEITKKYGFGYAFTETQEFANGLYTWYQQMRNNEGASHFNDLWEKVIAEDKHTMSAFNRFVLAEIHKGDIQ